MPLKYPGSDLQYPNRTKKEQPQEWPSFAFPEPRTRGEPEYGRGLSSPSLVPPGVLVVFLVGLSLLICEIILLFAGELLFLWGFG